MTFMSPGHENKRTFFTFTLQNEYIHVRKDLLFIRALSQGVNNWGQTWPYSVCCCGMHHLTSGCAFCRRSSRRSTWLPTWTRGVWWTCRSTKVAPEWSGKMLEGGKGAWAPLTHLPTQSVICLSEPAQRLLFFSLGGTEHDCVYITLLALREIKAVTWLCHGKTKQRDFLPYFNLGGKFVWHCYKKDGFKMFHLVNSWLYASPPCHRNVIPYCKMHVVQEPDVCWCSDNTDNSCHAIGCIFSSWS